VKAGDTFYAPLPPDGSLHLWVILSDPQINFRQVVIVPFMTIDNKNDTQDLTCVLNGKDHPFVKHPTFANYDCVKAPPLDLILAKKNKNGAAATPALLEKLRAGAAKSDRCELKYLRILEDQGLADPGC
jgi:hypothetical protein